VSIVAVGILGIKVELEVGIAVGLLIIAVVADCTVAEKPMMMMMFS
jgi:hypothetical protein